MIQATPGATISGLSTRRSALLENATIKILEEGQLRGKIRSISTYGSSTLTIDWTLYAGSKNPEAAVTLDWHEHLKMVKFSFPVDVEAPVATYETSYGTIIRATNGDEDPGQRWIDVTGKRGFCQLRTGRFQRCQIRVQCVRKRSADISGPIGSLCPPQSQSARHESGTPLDGSGYSDLPTAFGPACRQLAA